VLDLDRFKPINDTYGHQVGDRLLAAIGQGCGRREPSVRVYRLGGDEFGLIDSNVDDFTRTCERLLQQVRAAHWRNCAVGRRFFGHGAISRCRDQAADLFDRADYALYHAKHVNGGRLPFTPSLETAVRADRAIEAALQASSFEDELSIVLQPIVELSSGRLNGGGSGPLVQSDVGRSFHPMEFIAIAERSTAIHSITRAVFKKGLKAAQHLPEHVAVSFNISACDLTSACTLSFIRNEIASAGIAPGRIWIEVTETAVMQCRRRRTGARPFATLASASRSTISAPAIPALADVQRLPGQNQDRPQFRERTRQRGWRHDHLGGHHLVPHDRPVLCRRRRRNQAQRQILASTGCEYGQGYLSANPSRSKNCCPIAAVASALFQTLPTA
jgi:diguanylate cyclase (GGDEF)-like protein